ncbi:MAG: tetraacyldisaccharide 4'-kinase [Rhodospirillaceae bacterium]|nr:tetraacyldisaccharide 4'-kinase [Rhodospirillaceae bacterium]
MLLAGVAPTWVARDRKAGAEAAVTAGARAIVMDDGFQNPALAEDLSLIVVDGGYGFGNGRVMPAGPLREPVGDGLARADAVVRIGLDSANVATAISGALPVLEATLAAVEPEALGGRDVVAFAGIGRPAKFFETLEGLGCRLVARHAFPDHHPYRRDEVTRLIDEAAKANALAVTTAKDAVRLPVDLRQAVTVCEVALRWTDSTGIQALLRRTVGHG